MKKQGDIEFLSHAEILARRNRRAALTAGFFVGFVGALLVAAVWWWRAW